MKARSRSLRLAPLFLVTGAFLVSISCSRSQAQGAGGDSLADVSDKPLAPYQVMLLDVAFRAASAFPMMPHVKNRSRAQEEVVKTCFQLDQPRRALGYIERIDNWRRGVGYADFAFYCVRHDAENIHAAEVRRCLDLAREIANRPEEEEVHEVETFQDWQRDRIRAAIAKTHIWAGESEQAAELERGLAVSEIGGVEAVKAMRMEAGAAFETIQATEAFGGVASSGDFDQLLNALKTCVQLHDRFYSEEDRRSRLEDKLRSSWGKLPPQVRIELALELTENALDHGDSKTALRWVEETQGLIESSKWTPEVLVALRGRVAKLRHQSGDTKTARMEAEKALETFDAEQERIVDIYRASALRPLAEAYHAMGDRERALSIYKRALEESVVNANSRPRADDLIATSCSMAVNGCEPDPDLWTRITEVCDGLGEPW